LKGKREKGRGNETKRKGQQEKKLCLTNWEKPKDPSTGEGTDKMRSFCAQIYFDSVWGKKEPGETRFGS